MSQVFQSYFQNKKNFFSSIYVEIQFFQEKIYFAGHWRNRSVLGNVAAIVLFR